MAIIFNSKECGITKEEMKLLYRHNLIECNDFTFTVATIPGWAMEEAKNLIGKDFKGTVEFVVKHIEGYYEEDTDYWKKGDYWEDYVLEVVGHGINKVTGKPINFVGKQTGL